LLGLSLSTTGAQLEPFQQFLLGLSFQSFLSFVLDLSFLHQVMALPSVADSLRCVFELKLTLVRERTFFSLNSCHPVQPESKDVSHICTDDVLATPLLRPRQHLQTNSPETAKACENKGAEQVNL
jgi:hypothetical protein